MRHIRQAFKIFITVLISAVTIAFGTTNVYADERPEYRLGITPTQNNIGKLTPGTTYEGMFKVENAGKQTFDYIIDFAPYSVIGEEYEPNYTNETKYTEIKDWIKVSRTSGTIASGDIHEIGYRISVPEDAHGGAQSAIIVVKMLNPDKEANSSTIETVQQLGYLVFGNVDGEIIRTAQILENKIPSFLFNPPIKVTSIVENTGNVYTNATYILQVYSFFGNEEVYTNEEEPELKVIFPETKRYSELTWEGAPQLGLFKVKQTVKIFDEESVVEKIVFLCPLWFIFAIILFLAIAIFWIINRIRHRKDN